MVQHLLDVIDSREVTVYGRLPYRYLIFSKWCIFSAIALS